MKYMENHFDKRLNPTLLVDGAKKSVISLSYNYFPKVKIDEINNFKISKYAYGEDYHEVIKDILKKWWRNFRKRLGVWFQGFCRFCSCFRKSLG